MSHWYDSTPKKIPAQPGFEPGIIRSRGGRLTTRPTRRSPVYRNVKKEEHLPLVSVSKACASLFLRGDTVVQTKATLKVARTRVKRVLIYTQRQTMQPFVRYHGHKLQTIFQKGHYFVATYQQQLSRLPTTAPTLKVRMTVTPTKDVEKSSYRDREFSGYRQT